MTCFSFRFSFNLKIILNQNEDQIIVDYNDKEIQYILIT